MALHLIHTADWQLGKPFGNFPTDLAAELSAARLDTIGRIGAIARTQGAKVVLVAGDTFDSETLPSLILRRALERLAAENDLQWLILPGNHDPATTGGLWQRLAHIGLPKNVVPMLRPEPFALSDNSVVLPAPLSARDPGEDPTVWMAHAATPPGCARIGLAHGSVQGFGSDGESSVTIAVDRAERAGLSYLALGDWHGVKSITPRTWYSGTPEPDRFPDNEPGYVLSLRIDGPGHVEVQRIPSAHFTWAKMTASVATASDLLRLETTMATFGSRGLMRLNLTGSLSLEDYARLEDWKAAWTPRLRHLEIDTSSLAVVPQSADFEILAADGALAQAARELADLAANPDNPDQHSAQLALQRLFGFAAEARREGAL